MTMADEYRPKIDAMIGDLKFKELNDQMSKWADEGVIEDFDGQDSIPYFEFDWTLVFGTPEWKVSGEHFEWDRNADFNDGGFGEFEKFIYRAWKIYDLPAGHIGDIDSSNELTITAYLYELAADGIPSTDKAFWGYYHTDDVEIDTKWSVIKQFVADADKWDKDFEPDDEFAIGLWAEPWLNEVDIIFTDGSELHYDQNSIEA